MERIICHGHDDFPIQTKDTIRRRIGWFIRILFNRNTLFSQTVARITQPLDQVLKYLTLAEEHVTSTSIQSAGFTLGAVGSQKMKRWEADYVLEELDKLHLFDEYIEMSECKNKSFLYF